jgi:DNA polymerase-3 subunit gamma/tau
VLGVTEGETLAEISEIIARQDVAAVFAAVDRLIAEGKDIGRLIEDLTGFFRDLLRLSLGSAGEVWLQLGPQGEARMRSVAEQMGPDRLLAAVHAMAELQTQLRTSAQHAILLELALTELCGARPEPAAVAAPPARPAASATPTPAAATKAAAPQPEAAPAKAPPVSSPAPARTQSQPAAPVLAGEVTCGTIRGNWENLVAQLKRMGQVPVAAIVREAVPAELRDDTLVIAFPPEYRFHYERVRDSYQSVVCEALGKLLGQPMRLECKLCDTEDEFCALKEGQVEAPPDLAKAPAAAEAALNDGEPSPSEGIAAAPEAAPPVIEPAPEEGDGTMTVDQAAEQTLSLFEGAEELFLDDNPPG